MANVLVIGSGGREHALCWRLKQSPQVHTVYCAPGNGGIAEDVTCVTLATPQEIINFCTEKSIALVVIGPEQPLVDGWADILRTAGLTVFGCSKEAAQLEGSKAFTKRICDKYNIPTAAYEEFAAAPAAKKYLDGKPYPIVVKADGLAAGKGVIIAENKAEAESAIDELLSAHDSIVIEEFMDGEEVSLFVLCDGTRVIPIGFAQDHKRVFDGDKGPNTGGMGSYSPPPVFTEALFEQSMREIVEPTARGMAEEGMPFQGIFFAGLMLTKQGPKLLEYNVRFGDPETQSLMMRFEGDLYQLLLDCAQGTLKHADLQFRREAAVCVVMATQGYPGSYEKGSIISGLEQAGGLEDVKIFHAGTTAKEGKMLATGGRVLGVTALGKTIAEAQAKAYQAVDLIDWPEGFCRRDIAFRAVG